MDHVDLPPNTAVFWWCQRVCGYTAHSPPSDGLTWHCLCRADVDHSPIRQAVAPLLLLGLLQLLLQLLDLLLLLFDHYQAVCRR